MRTALVALLLLTAGTTVLLAAPSASACPINMGGDLAYQLVNNCVPVVGPTAWSVACGDAHVCP